MSEAALARDRHRTVKFSPERIEQIKNLVERGKSREEIAEIIGCTAGTLTVMCSRVGISLRRPRFDMVGGRSRGQLPVVASDSGNGGERHTLAAAALAGSKPAPRQTLSPTRKLITADDVGIAIEIAYRGVTRRTELPLDQQAIGKLALEAEIRNLRLGEFIARLLAEWSNTTS